MTPRFDDKYALVTGGTSGIGRAVATALAAAGARVVATGLEGKPEPPGTGLCSIDFRQLDVADGDAVVRLAESLPRLDILVNGAATILRDGREFDPVAFARVVDVNLVGMMRVCAACLARLGESRGCVVNVASMLSFFGSGFVPAYSASKGGVAQLTRSLAIAWASRGIRVNAVAPGWIETPLTEPLYRDAARRQAILDRTPMGRWGRPEDVAGPVLFLCSNDAAFVTGVILAVDGGYAIA
jgi:NAD(P)-dependent dehydrogenase (short-subunit alcohol dehydrogenase family)